MFEPGGFERVSVSAARVESMHGEEPEVLLERAVAWLRVAAQAQAGGLAAVARLARIPVLGDELSGVEATVAEFAAAVPMSSGAATGLVETALALTRDLRETYAAVRTGVIDLARARALVDEVAVAQPDPDTRAEVEKRVLDGAPRRTPAQVRHDVRRAVQAVDPAAAEQRHVLRRAERHVRAQSGPDGMGYLDALLPADGIAVVNGVLDDLADGYREHCRATGADPGTHDQRRADAFLGVFTAIADQTPLPRDERGVRFWVPPVLPKRHGRRARVLLRVTAATLTGAAEEPGELGRFGPVPAGMARRLAVGADPAPVAEDCTDRATGECRLHGVPTPYRPLQHLRDVVVARDGRCRHPHCRRPATQCDIDHLRPHRDDGGGGPTCPCNLLALCRRHHRLKHHGWKVEPLDPVLRAAGPLRWTSPLGRAYRDTS